MKKITIVSSKKYIRSSQFKSLIEVLDSKKIVYEYIDLDKCEDDVKINSYIQTYILVSIYFKKLNQLF